MDWSAQLPTLSKLRWWTWLALAGVYYALLMVSVRESVEGLGWPVDFVDFRQPSPPAYAWTIVALDFVCALFVLRIVMAISESWIWDAIWTRTGKLFPEYTEPDVPATFPLTFHLLSYFIAMLVASLFIYPNVVHLPGRYFETSDGYYGFPFKIFYSYTEHETMHVGIFSTTSLIATILVGISIPISALVGCEVVSGIRQDGLQFLRRLWRYLRPSLTTVILGRSIFFVGFCLQVLMGDQGLFGWPLPILYCRAGEWLVGWGFWVGYRDLIFDCYVWLAIILIPCIICETIVRRRQRARVAKHG